MKETMPYKDLNHALRKLRCQISESIPYCIENFPSLSSPEKIFKYLKPRVTYKHDPKGRELFQTTETLFDNNRHGIPGAGDCDCFTITAIATLIANGFTDCGIVLAGRNPWSAKHIYAYVVDNGQRKIFDLTNGSYNYERYYPYKQSVPYQLNKNEKDMILELADGGPSNTTGKYGKPGYIYFPSKGVHVREDYFDNLSAGKFQSMCLEEGIPVTDLEELSGRRAERRRDERVARKAQKPRNQRKMVATQAKAQKKRDQGSAAKMRSQARIDKANRPEPQRPVSPYENSYQNYNQPDEGEQEYEEVDTAPEQEPDTDMEEGEMSLGKKILWGLGLTVAGFAAGYELKKRSRGQRAA